VLAILVCFAGPRGHGEFLSVCKLKLIAVSHSGCAIEHFGDANNLQFVCEQVGIKFHGNLHSDQKIPGLWELP